MDQLPLMFISGDKQEIQERPYQLYEYKVIRSMVSDVAASPSIRQASDANSILTDYFSALDREHFVVLHLNSQNRVIARETISIGTLTMAAVHPREVFKSAVINSSASIMVAHNYPSGDPSPSRNDIELTKRLVDAGDMLGIQVMDHIICSHDSYSSLRDMGYIAK